VKLTEDQIKAVKPGEPVRLAPEEVGEEVVLLRSDVYDRIAELLDDWDPRLMRGHLVNIMKEDWDDPPMRAYD
jgi:hypothetical protein